MNLHDECLVWIAFWGGLLLLVVLIWSYHNLNIKCVLFGHTYILHRKVNSYVREMKCKKCDKKFAMNDDMQTLLPLDYELQKLHTEMIFFEQINKIK